MQAESEAIETAMAEALTQGLPPDSDRVQTLMARHHAWISRSWNRPAPAQAFTGLGAMYVEDPRFRAHYDDRAKGLAEYMAAAMTTYAAGMG
jgi:MerR family transcriptional regulator, thiopeptide resistance regulator